MHYLLDQELKNIPEKSLFTSNTVRKGNPLPRSGCVQKNHLVNQNVKT